MKIIRKLKKFSNKHQKFYIWFYLQSNPFRIITSPCRRLPDFIIFGCARSGTVALNRYLNQHPNISMASRKEVHFFNKNIHHNQGQYWYRSFFPMKIFSKKLIVGESTPDYIYNPDVAKRIKKILPHVKLIVVLRNPIDRAYSHYQYMVRTKRENISFEDAIESEQDRIKDEKIKGIFDGDNYRAYSYLDRGVYIEQFQNWLNSFPKEQILIIKNENLEEKTESTLNEVFNFLGVEQKTILDTSKFNVGKYPTMKNETRLKLISFFKESNEKLEKFLGMKFDWD